MIRTISSGIALLIAAAAAGAQEPRPRRPDLEVILIVDGGMGGINVPVRFWSLRIGFKGEIDAAGNLNPGVPEPSTRLTPAAHTRVEALLDKERFFVRQYRTTWCAPDIGARMIKAWRGTTQRSVSFCLDGPDVAVSEARSLLRVWYGVLSIVADGKTVPVSDPDKRLLAK